MENYKPTLREIIENVQEQISDQVLHKTPCSYSLVIKESVFSWEFSHFNRRSDLDANMRFAYWLLEEIKNAANDSEQAPEVDINDNET